MNLKLRKALKFISDLIIAAADRTIDASEEQNLIASGIAMLPSNVDKGKVSDMLRKIADQLDKA